MTVSWPKAYNDREAETGAWPEEKPWALKTLDTARDLFVSVVGSRALHRLVVPFLFAQGPSSCLGECDELWMSPHEFADKNKKALSAQCVAEYAISEHIGMIPLWNRYL